MRILDKAPTVLYSLPYIYSTYRMYIGIGIDPHQNFGVYSSYTVYDIDIWFRPVPVIGHARHIVALALPA